MDLIYQDPTTQGIIYQGGYSEIPWDLHAAHIHLVIYAAAECPPLNHHLGGEKVYCPNNDSVPTENSTYQALLENAQKAVPKVVETIQAGKNALVTCNQGLNRSGLVVGLALQQLTTFAPHSIIALIQNRRRGALNNETFQAMIIKEKL